MRRTFTLAASICRPAVSRSRHGSHVVVGHVASCETNCARFLSLSLTHPLTRLENQSRKLPVRGLAVQNEVVIFFVSHRPLKTLENSGRVGLQFDVGGCPLVDDLHFWAVCRW